MNVKTYILQTSFAFKEIWSTLSKFLDDMILKKITLTSSSTHDELKALIHPSQLEQKYGGEAPNYEPPYWPPRMPKYVIDEKIEKKLVPEEEYEKFLQEHPELMRRPSR